MRTPRSSRIIPGRGLRHAQPSASSCGHTTTRSTPVDLGDHVVDRVDLVGRRRAHGRCRAGSSRRRVSSPAARKASIASRDTGQDRRRRRALIGGYGRPPRTTAALSTPSRSRNTAPGTPSPSEPLTVGDHRLHRLPERLTGRPRARPTRSPRSSTCRGGRPARRPSSPRAPPAYSRPTSVGSSPATSMASSAISVTVM